MRILKDNTRRSLKARRWALAVIKKDFCCQNCKRSDTLVAHHIIPWEESKELRFDLTNGLTLCLSCHNSHHHKGKSTGIPWNKGSTGYKGEKPGRKKGTLLTEEQKDKLRKPKNKSSKPRKARCRIVPPSEYCLQMAAQRFKGNSWKINAETGKRYWIK